MVRIRSSRAALKVAHQLLQPTASLADMLAVPSLSRLLNAVAAGHKAKLRAQRKNRQAQAPRAEVSL